MPYSFSLQDILFLEKPAGIPTHQVDINYPGFIEQQELALEKKLFPCHRLDKETSGILTVATSQEAASEISRLFSEQEVKKKYVLITDQKPKDKKWTHHSIIKNTECTTHFQFVAENAGFYYLEAQPETGKTHQIRIHAQESGIPILGDTLYGGTAHVRLFLHALSLKIPSLDLFQERKIPRLFTQLERLHKIELCSWIHSYERRHTLYPLLSKPPHCLRLIHDEGTALRLDQLGEVLYFGWWSEQQPTAEQWSQLKEFILLLPNKYWLLRQYPKDAKKRVVLDASEHLPESWAAEENHINYEFRKDQGLSPGLFLDQRSHRQWVKENSKDKKVLNLFCYTGGFSVCSAHGGASEVVSVDLSSTYIDWTKKNFEINDLNSDRFKFYSMDTFEYLKYATKKEISFDLIVCDPPSFGRNKKKVFRIEKDFENLIKACAQCLNKNGLILFSTNYEAWDLKTWEKNLTKICQELKLQVEIAPYQSWDFEIDPRKAVLKAFHIVNK